MLKRIKWENIYLILISPIPVIQFMKAAEGFKIASIIASIALYGGLYLCIRIIRKENINEKF